MNTKDLKFPPPIISLSPIMHNETKRSERPVELPAIIVNNWIVGLAQAQYTGNKEQLENLLSPRK